MGKTVKRIWNGITTVIVAAVVILALLLVGARVVGLRNFVVLSGSMEPTYHVGSLIYVKPVDPFELKNGDVITFVINEDLTVATHRIVEILPDENDPAVLRFRTKGDANENADERLVYSKAATADSPAESNVVGKVVFSIPYMGYVANYIQNPPGTYIAISAGAVLLLLVFLPDLLFGNEDKKKKQGEAEPPRES